MHYHYTLYIAYIPVREGHPSCSLPSWCWSGPTTSSPGPSGWPPCPTPHRLIVHPPRDPYNRINMVRAPAGVLYCLRFSKCISSHLIHEIVENAWFWTLIIKNCWHAHVQKRGTARSKMSAFIRIHCVFPKYLQTPSEIAWISKLFFYFPRRLSLQSLPRLLKTWPSLKRRHCPRHRYFHNAISLIFPLDSRLYVTPAYMTLSHPPHPTPTPPHLQTY